MRDIVTGAVSDQPPGRGRLAPMDRPSDALALTGSGAATCAASHAEASS